LKKITTIILFLFLISLVTPAIQSIVEDVCKSKSFCDIEKTEKETEKSEEKELEKNEIEFFDKILISEKINFSALIQPEFTNLFHFLNNHNSQFREIYSPPPEFI
jgi:hypothetical protein